jgi:hypothetical protein
VPVRQISKQRKPPTRYRALDPALKAIANHLEQYTYWGKYLARSAQVRAGARKLYDVTAAQVRREQKQAVRG